MKKLQTVTGTINNVMHRFRNDEPPDVLVVSIEDGPICIGPLDEDHPIVQGMTYRFYGNTKQHPKYGEQFAWADYIKHLPHSQEGIIKYLVESCEGIGKKIAQDLYAVFGSDAVKELRENPLNAASAVDSLRYDVAVIASEKLQSVKEDETAKLDMLDLFAGRGFPRSLIQQCFKKWGPKAPAVVRRDPWKLLTNRMPGCGFMRVDKLFLDLGGSERKIKRLVFAAWHSIRTGGSGDTWHSIDTVIRGCRDRVCGMRIPEQRIDKAMRVGIRAGWLARRGDFIADALFAESESLAARYVRLHLSPNEWQIGCDESLSDHQFSAVNAVIGSNISCLIGSPGTGKTYCVARIVKHAEAQGMKVVCCAPTGKAAMRIQETLTKYGIEMSAKTVHSTLIPVKTGYDNDGWQFMFGPDRPLEADLIICDEASMLDTNIAACLVSAVDVGSQIIFVGDTGQLPPVGHGAFLRDLIAAGVPTGELTEIRRNDGLVPELCLKIRNNDPWVIDSSMAVSEGKNVAIKPAMSPGHAIKVVCDIARNLESKDVDLIADFQVLAAVRESGKLSIKELNAQLRGIINPSEDGESKLRFREGDKVICTSNSYFPEDVKCDSCTPKFRQYCRHCKGKGVIQTEHYVANGEIGVVQDAESSFIEVLWSFPNRYTTIRLKTDKGNAPIELAYAITCHKSQGSEWKYVVVVADDGTGAKMVCSREWWYTAISRASRACWIVGRLGTVFTHCRKVVLPGRQTFLKDLICEGES